MPISTPPAARRPAGTGWQRLVDRTLWRLRWAIVALRSLYAFFALVAIYCSAVLVARLTGIFALTWQPWVPVLLPVVALAIGAAWPRRPGSRDAARAVDRGAATHDLFLTMVLLEGSAGEYQPLVAAKAESRAATIRPREVAPLRINRRLTSIAVVLAMLVGVVQFVPQLDPFGKVAAAEETREELRHIEESKQATQERLAKIERESLSDAQAKEVKQALDELKAAMKGTQIKARQANSKLLAGAQKTVAGEWRKISSGKLNDLFSKSSAAASQQMGSNSGAMSKKWLDDLQAGSTESLRKELSSVQRDLEELAKTKDPARKAELTQKLRERLDALTQFAEEQTGSKTLAAALKRTQEQMRMAAKAAAGDPKDPATEEALKAAAESAKLADKELEQIAQSAKDLKDLEQALSVLQMAKNLNNKDLLDGQKMEGLQSMAEYEAMYDKLMKDATPDTGEFGEGGPVDENDSKKSKFKTELSKSQISKGKVLLTLKTKGMGEHADVKEQYRSAVRDVKQGLSEAILREEIPPGYHEGLKGYFDSIEETPPAGK
jgi:hypothetical protein